MNFGEMKDWVGRTTKRPEKRDDQIHDAVNAAIEYATTMGDFAADLTEGQLSIDGTVYSQSIVIASSFTRFRKIKYLRPDGYSRYLKWCDPSRVFITNLDGHDQEKQDVWYRAGANIVFKLSRLQTIMKYGYFQYAALMTADGDANWKLTQMPTVIHDLSCWRIYELVGNESEASRFFSIASKLLLAAKADQDGVAHS